MGFRLSPKSRAAQPLLLGSSGIRTWVGFGVCLQLLLVGLPHTVFAQNDQDSSLPGSFFEITGQVRSSDGCKTVQFVSVRLERLGGSLVDQRTTDSTGKFRFSRITAGQYVVSAGTQGFKVAPQSIEISRFIPRVHLLLQLTPEESPFAKRDGKPGVVDVRLAREAMTEFERAREAQNSNKPQEALLHLEKAVKISPEFFDAQLLLGSTYLNDGRLDKAATALRQALKINPKSVSVMVTLGELHRREKDYTNAEQLLLQALKEEEEAWVGHYTLARVYWDMNEIVKAGRQVGRAIQLNLQYAEAHLLGGNVFMKIGMIENAIIEYEEYLRLAPEGHLAPQTQRLVQKLRKSLPNQKR